jgi:hypothetical protein
MSHRKRRIALVVIAMAPPKNSDEKQVTVGQCKAKTKAR